MGTHRHLRMQSPDGFTLIELLVVVAILGILVSVATVSYQQFVAKAKAVEGEIAIHEVDRLEQLHYASTHAYTDSLDDLGFAMGGSLKYYTPEVRIGSPLDKISYQVRALPVTASSTDAWLLTSYRDGSVKIERTPVNDLAVYASLRYMGIATVMSPGEAASVYLGSGISGDSEPEWSGMGSNSRCQECGRTVVNQRSGQK